MSWLSIIYFRNLTQIKQPLSSERVKRKLRAEYARADIVVKTSLKTDKRKWIDNITGEARKTARNQRIKTLHGLTKTLCN